MSSLQSASKWAAALEPQIQVEVYKKWFQRSYCNLRKRMGQVATIVDIQQNVLLVQKLYTFLNESGKISGKIFCTNQLNIRKEEVCLAKIGCVYTT